MGLFKRNKIWWFIKQSKKFGRVEASLGTDKKKLAEQMYAEILPRILNGSYFKPTPKIPTVREIINRYMREVSPTQKSHERNMEIAPHYYEFFQDSLASDAKSMLPEYKAKRLLGEIRYGRGKGRVAGEPTVKRELSFLRQVFNYAINNWDEDWGGYFNENEVNPVKKVIKGLKDNKRVRYLLKEEAVSLRKALLQSKIKHLFSMVIVACQTGLREGNIVNLLRSECDFDGNRINKPAEVMKNGEPHSAKMTDTVKTTLMQTLRNRKFISPYIFTDDRGQPYNTNEVSMAFGRACKRAGIVNLRFHDLRHDYATMLLNNGASLTQVQHNLGVSDPRMTLRYAHLLPENRDVADRIEGKGTAAILLAEDDDEDFTTILRQQKKNKRGYLA